MTGFQSKRQAAEDKLATHEEQQEFESRRNYAYETNLQTILIDALKEAHIKLAVLELRIQQLESYHRDDGK